MQPFWNLVGRLVLVALALYGAYRAYEDWAPRSEPTVIRTNGQRIQV